MSGPMIEAYSHLVWLRLMSWVQALEVGAVMLVGVKTLTSYDWLILLGTWRGWSCYSWTHIKQCWWPFYGLSPLCNAFLVTYGFLFVWKISTVQLWSLWASSLILSLWKSMEWSLIPRPWTLSTLRRSKSRHVSSSYEWTLTAFDVIVNCNCQSFLTLWGGSRLWQSWRSSGEILARKYAKQLITFLWAALL